MSAFFNLDTPPGFHGLAPDRSVQVYHRTLPHWRQQGATYFVTFRLADSLPQNKLNELKREQQQWQIVFEAKLAKGELSETEKTNYWGDFARTQYQKIESCLDQGIGKCILQGSQYRKILIEALDYFDGKHYELYSYVIMPNHVHLLIKPLSGNKLEKILQSRKRNSAFGINKIDNQQGSIWQSESFDRIVRDAEHLWRCIQYIGKNPQKAALDEKEYTRWVKPSWKTLGWDFLE